MLRNIGNFLRIRKAISDAYLPSVRCHCIMQRRFETLMGAGYESINYVSQKANRVRLWVPEAAKMCCKNSLNLIKIVTRWRCFFNEPSSVSVTLLFFYCYCSFIEVLFFFNCHKWFFELIKNKRVSGEDDEFRILCLHRHRIHCCIVFCWSTFSSGFLFGFFIGERIDVFF